MSSDGHADIMRLRADNMTMQVIVAALIHAMSYDKPDGGTALLADLTSNIERLTTATALINADNAGRDFVRKSALQFVSGLVQKSSRH